MNVEPLFRLMVDKKASDLFFTCFAPVKIKIDGKIMPVNKLELTPKMVKQAAMELMDEDQLEEFTRELEIDFALSKAKLGRFRVNIFHQRGNIGMVLRYISSDMPDLDKLNMPQVMKELVMFRRGLVLMVGATGCGKSTTLAGMINYRNERASSHILTIEDPIEFLHPNKRSIVNQREIGIDTRSYARALKSAMREAPDVILIGEIRDRESMEAALHLAGTGHLVISTLHLSQYLRAVVSQRLVLGTDGKRIAAVEVMLNTPHVSELINRGEIAEVKEAFAQSSESGMQSFDVALLKLYKDGKIGMEEALANADSRSNLEASIHFG